MGLTKKQLQSMIIEAVRIVVTKEIKPMIRKTIRQEFYKIVDEVGNETEKNIEEETMSMSNLLSEGGEDETRQVVQEKLFKSGQFADILNDTANQYRGRSISNETPVSVVNEQKEVVLSDDQRTSLVDKMGYGDGFEGVGSGVSVPGSETPRSKSPLKSILNKTGNRPKTPSKVLLPTKNADGRPINLDNVPAQIIQNMMKDYSGMLKKVEGKSNFTRGGGPVKKGKSKASLDSFNKPKSQFEKYEEDKK